MLRRVLFSFGLAAVFAVPVLGGSTAPAEANHSWNGYHWARTSNPFTLNVGDNVDSAWDSTLNTTVVDWSKSTVLDLVKVNGASSSKNSRATSGRVEVCNARYGNNGWLGVATVWASSSHITQGTVRLNDTYFSTSRYNRTEWRNLVSCQEVGHTLGLDHQDENFTNANLDTCMDYTNLPDSNQHPNQHDYDELVTIYSHLDSTTTLKSLAATARGAKPLDDEPGDGPPAWGHAVRNDPSGRANVYEQDQGNGRKKITHVFWAPRGNGN